MQSTESAHDRRQSQWRWRRCPPAPSRSGKFQQLWQAPAAHPPLDLPGGCWCLPKALGAAFSSAMAQRQLERGSGELQGSAHSAQCGSRSTGNQFIRGRLERGLSKSITRHAQHSKNCPRDLDRKACAAAARPDIHPSLTTNVGCALEGLSWPVCPVKATTLRALSLPSQSPPTAPFPPPPHSQPPLPSLLFLSAPPRSPPRAVCATSRALPLDRLAASTTPEPDRCANGPRRGVSAAGSGSSRPSRRVLEPVPDAPAWGARPRPQPVSRPSSSGRTVCEAERGRGAGGRACRRA